MPLEQSQRETYVDIRAWMKSRHKQVHKSAYIDGGPGKAHNSARSVAEITFPRALTAYRELRADQRKVGLESANKTQRRKIAQAVLFAYDETFQGSMWMQLSRIRQPRKPEHIAAAAISNFILMDGVIDRVKDGFGKFPDPSCLDLTATELAQKVYGTESFRSDQALTVMTGLAIVAIGELTPAGDQPQLPDPLITKLGVAPEWEQPRIHQLNQL